MNTTKRVIKLNWRARLALAVAWPFVALAIMLIVGLMCLVAWPYVAFCKTEIVS